MICRVALPSKSYYISLETAIQTLRWLLKRRASIVSLVFMMSLMADEHRAKTPQADVLTSCGATAMTHQEKIVAVCPQDPSIDFFGEIAIFLRNLYIAGPGPAQVVAVLGSTSLGPSRRASATALPERYERKRTRNDSTFDIS